MKNITNNDKNLIRDYLYEVCGHTYKEAKDNVEMSEDSELHEILNSNHFRKWKNR